jgi:hypothetical protein
VTDEKVVRHFEITSKYQLLFNRPFGDGRVDFRHEADGFPDGRSDFAIVHLVIAGQRSAPAVLEPPLAT